MSRIAGPPAILAALASVAAAQTERPAPRFEAQTELIQIDVAVTRKGGERVLNLTREDFVLLEDGKPQVITHFARRAVPGIGGTTLAVNQPPAAGAAIPLPELDVQGRLMVVAVDTQSLEPSTFLNMKQKVLAFVDEQIGRDDQVALVTTSGHMLQPFTTDRDVLRRAVQRVRSADMKASPFAERPEMTTYQADLILRNDRGARQEYASRLLREDPLLPPQMVEAIMNTRARRIMAEAARTARNTLAVLEGLIRPLAAFPGRKTLVLLSNGFFTREDERPMLQAVTAAAARAGVVIYSLDTRGLTVTSAAGPVGDASVGGRPSIMTGTFNYAWLGFEAERNGLNALAKDTGGLPIFNADLGAGLRNVLADSETGYVLGYEPQSPATDERYHRVEVKVPGRSGLEIRAHRGYFGRGAEAKRVAAGRKTGAASPPPNPLRDALLSLMPRQDLPLDLAAGYADTDAGATVVIAARVRPAGAQADAAGNAARKVQVLGVIYDEEGQPLSNFNDERESTGVGRITFDTHTTLPPGRYQVRAAATDGARFGTASLWTEVPDLSLGTFTLTDLFVTEGDAPPRPVRSGHVFSRATPVEFTLFACNPKGDAERHADVVFETVLRAGDRVVAQEPPFVVTVPVTEPRPPRIGYARAFPLAALDPGEYTLRINIADRVSRATALRELDFRVE